MNIKTTKGQEKRKKEEQKHASIIDYNSTNSRMLIEA